MDPKPLYTLGLSCFYHDSAACILRNGELLAAAGEERFTRIKHDDHFPKNAVDYCLKEAGITVNDLNYVCFYEKPFLKFERLLKSYIHTWPRGLVSFVKSMRVWLGKKLWMGSVIKKNLGWKGEICYVPHHLSHAASAYYPSPFSEAVILTLDGVGEFSTASIGYAKRTELLIDEELVFPHSLGLLYSAVTYYMGFKVNSAEYKVMGLSPYGKPIFVDQIKKVVKVFDDGSIKLDMRYFAYEYGLTMITNEFEKLFGHPTRHEGEKLEQFHMDMAASLQAITEEIVLKMANHAYEKHPCDNLCLAGGVALNCVANSRVLNDGKFKNLFIFPAAGDAGGAVGAATYVYHHILKKTDRHPLKNVYLGPQYSHKEIQNLLKKHQIPFEHLEDEPLFTKIADYINEDKVVGLFQGRMEFGPRALGNRSILGDARKKENWQRVNLKIKFRESFRPFAPTVMEDHLSEVYDLKVPTQYMLLTAQTKSKDIPATTHVDGSARIQSVSSEQNHRYYRIIEEFYKKTGCPVVINTSFNVRGEPIVCSPEDALKCFLRTDIDILVLENCVIHANQVDKTTLRSQFVLETFGDD